MPKMDVKALNMLLTNTRTAANFSEREAIISKCYIQNKRVVV
jgi:hypothetical protein